MPTDPIAHPLRTSGLALDVAEIGRVALRDRWGLALVAVGYSHLAVFLFCQFLYGRGDRAETHFLPLWGLDLGLATLILRKALGRPSKGPTPALLPVVVRIWITFLILTFSTATLNSLVGFQTDWFKATWSTLATFGFATMAWLFHLGFLVPAVQMSITALLIARNPHWAYGIYGFSWCLALNLVGLALERRRAVLASGVGARRSHAPAIGARIEVG